MDKATLNSVLDVQDKALADPVYQKLYAQYEGFRDRFLELMNSLSEQERSDLENFLGVSAAMHLRLLELAVSDYEKRS